MTSVDTVLSLIRSAGIIILHFLQMRILLKNTTFLQQEMIRVVGIIIIELRGAKATTSWQRMPET